ncbi:MAG: hypothetical protein HY825_10425 [Acidobacteria bacterium]|nr:hypothetical protein [Acidobacteriota bacterium]
MTRVPASPLVTLAALLACALLAAGSARAAGDPAADMKVAIERATSLAEVRAAYLKFKPTAADLARVAKALEGTPHATKLAELARQADARSKALAHRQQSSPPTQLLVDATARLGRLNQQARAEFAAAAHTGVGGAARRPAPTRPLTPELDATMLGAGAASDPDAPRIQMLLPRVIDVGGEFTITGQRFGAGRGRILFGFREPRIAVEAPDLSHWAEGRIVGTVPREADQYLTQGGSNEAVLWVETAGTATHRTGMLIRLIPLRPHIESLSSAEVMPGQEIVVRGSEFGSTRGRIDFELAGLRIAGEVGGSDWTDTAIHVRLGDVRGMIGTRGRLHVETERHRTTSHAIEFVPLQETRTYTDLASHHYSPGCGFGPCADRSITALVHLDLTRTLENQWVLESAALSRRGGGSCRYDPAAVPGSDRVPHLVVIEGDAYDDVVCTSRVTLRGPAGTPNYR